MKYVADHWSRDIEIIDADGCHMVDAQGNRYLDFLAGWCVGNVGWKRPEVIKAIKQQADRGFYVPPYLRYGDWDRFAKTILSVMPNKKLSRVYRCTSGSESVEFAIKLARAATGKKTIVSIDHVYHGHTYGAASVGDALTDGMEPGVPGFMKLPQPNTYRGIDTNDVLSRFEQLIRANDDIAAFLSEPVWSNAGVVIPPADFYPALERLCRQHGILFIMDEVATGFGRCGALFASSLWGLQPDIVCLGKGMTGGYATMGATAVTEEIFKAGAQIPHTSTFGWLPQDVAAAQAAVDVILRERLWENAHHVGMSLLDRLRQFENRPFVGQVRGVGLLLGIEIVKDKNEKVPDPGKAEWIVNEAAKKGLLVESVGSVVFLSPPLTLSSAEAEEGAAILDQVLH